MLLNAEKTILSYIRLHLLKVLHFTYFITTIYIWGQTKKQLLSYLCQVFASTYLKFAICKWHHQFPSFIDIVEEISQCYVPLEIIQRNNCLFIPSTVCNALKSLKKFFLIDFFRIDFFHFKFLFHKFCPTTSKTCGYEVLFFLGPLFFVEILQCGKKCETQIRKSKWIGEVSQLSQFSCFFWVNCPSHTCIFCILSCLRTDSREHPQIQAHYLVGNIDSCFLQTASP